MPEPVVNHSTQEDSTLSGTVSNAAAQVQDKLSDLSRTAGNKIEENRQAAAGGLQKVAAALHEKADNLPGVQTMSGLAHGVADKLTSTADYVREHNLNKLIADVQALVKRSPGPSLLAAAVVGFLAARAFRNND